MPSSDSRAGPILVDGHVHLHPGFDPAILLSAADRNFSIAAEELGLDRIQARVLLMGDRVGSSTVARLACHVEVPGSSWRVLEADDGRAFVAQKDDTPPLWMIQGWQLVSEERLEVLALATASPLEDGGSFPSLLGQARSAGAITVVPWGFGKWIGQRGRQVQIAIGDAEPGSLHVGDSGCRLAGTPTPRLLRKALSRGIFDLPGSDPLPLKGQERRAGSRGFVLTGRLDTEAPARGIRRLVRALGSQPRRFGRGTPLLSFVRSQVRMQLLKVNHSNR